MITSSMVIFVSFLFKTCNLFVKAESKRKRTMRFDALNTSPPVKGNKQSI